MKSIANTKCQSRFIPIRNIDIAVAMHVKTNVVLDHGLCNGVLGVEFIRFFLLITRDKIDLMVI